ncbi:MAG: hypothetical protein V1909_03885 [Candidatus Micrarchaeota archaeon]
MTWTDNQEESFKKNRNPEERERYERLVTKCGACGAEYARWLKYCPACGWCEA